MTYRKDAMKARDATLAKGVPSWVYEFGAEYDVPDVIARAEGIEDMSWHNDSSPSFGVFMDDDKDDTHDLRIYVEHPDPSQREVSVGRFSVSYHPWNRPVEGLPLADDDDLIYDGDDAGAAVAAFRAALATIQVEVARRHSPIDPAAIVMDSDPAIGIRVDGDPSVGSRFVRIPTGGFDLLVGVDDDGAFYVTAESPDGILWEVSPKEF